jgi:hypothetical protein
MRLDRLTRHALTYATLLFVTIALFRCGGGNGGQKQILRDQHSVMGDEAFRQHYGLPKR